MKSHLEPFSENKPALILMAEDDEDDYYFIKKALSEVSLNLNLKRFKNGEELVNFLKTNTEKIEFIMLDLNMPIMTGREALKVIRQELQLDIPIHILSVSNHLHEKEICFENGATNYFVKPYSYGAYVELMKTLLDDQHILEPIPDYRLEKKSN